jgi:3-deoxy-manno-octulosonate cytidylyltransferase (CMP-KDO synthetase)
MVQGDEPMIIPHMIRDAIAPMLDDPSIRCVNLARRITSREQYVDPNTIKVVMNIHGDALYFSRTPIPVSDRAHDSASDFTSDFLSERVPIFKQVCVIPFRRDYLREFARLPPTPLERAESIDMLRVLEHGGRVRLVETEVDTQAVDTPADLRLVASLLKDDPLALRYGETLPARPAARV